MHPFSRRLIVLLSSLAMSAALAAQTAPTPVTSFRFEPQGFKFINHDAEFRDPSDRMWPNFYTGRPTAGGVLNMGATPSVNLTIVYDQMVQKNSDQSRKILGELCAKGEFPVVTLTLNQLSGVKYEAPKNNKEKNRRYSAQLAGTLQIGARRTPVTPDGVITLFMKDDKPERITLVATVTCKPADLGLAKLPPDTVIKIRLTTNGTPGSATPPAKK